MKLFLLPLALLLSAPAFTMEGEHSDKNKPQEQQEKSMSFKDISKAKSLNKLHHINKKEIEISKMAKEKAQSQEVKDLANTIAQDHEMADKKLQETAKSMNIELNDFSAATYEKVVMEKLDKLEGKDFDQAYLKYMDKGHKTAMNEVESIEKELDNEEVSTYVKNLKPELKKHDEKTSTIMSSEKFAE